MSASASAPAASPLGRLVAVSLVPAEPSAAWRLLWLVVAPLPCALALIRVPDRTDYLGHFLAGHGATLALGWIVARAAGGRPLAVLAAVVVAIGLGAVTEATVFALPSFSLIDFAAQSMGAAIAGIALVECATGDPALDASPPDSLLGLNAHARVVLAVALVGVVAGFVFAFA